MRVVFVHPNYRSGGAEIADKWPQAPAAELMGATAITPSTGAAQRILEFARQHTPNARSMLAGGQQQMHESLAEETLA